MHTADINSDTISDIFSVFFRFFIHKRERQTHMLLNDPDQIRLRRSQSTLFNIGTGIVIFGVWTIVKTLLTLLTGRYQIFKTAQELSAGSEYFVSPRIFAVLLVIMFAAMAFIDIWLRFYVGLHARRDARGKKAGRLYIIITCLMILGSILLITANIYTLVTRFMAALAAAEAAAEEAAPPANSDISITGVLIELTSLIMMIELVASAGRVRKLGGHSGSGGSTEQESASETEHSAQTGIGV